MYCMCSSAYYLQNQATEYSVVMKVRQAISELTVNPADFDKVVVPLIDVFAVSVREESTLAAIIEEIFVQASSQHYSTRLLSCHY